MASTSHTQPQLVASSSKKRKLVEDTRPTRTTDELPKPPSANTLQYPGGSMDGGSGSEASSTEFDDTRIPADESKKGKSTARKRREGGQPVRKYASACQFCRRRKVSIFVTSVRTFLCRLMTGDRR